MRRVLFAGGGTGGHLYPALALADALRNEAQDIDVHFVGARRGIEAQVLPRRGVAFTLLPVEPFYRSRVLRNWRLLPSMTVSLVGMASLYRRFRPQLVVGTGGYASAPACLYGSLRRVPVAVQEQNAHPGATTRMLARRARQIHLGFPEAEGDLSIGPRTRVFTYGNPIRPPDASIDRAAARTALRLSPDSTVVLIVGGSQGAHAINESLMVALRDISSGKVERPRGIELLWATGPTHFDSVRVRVSALGQADWVHATGYIEDMPRALAVADLAVSRAGAMMTGELLAWGVPSILVPLPTAAADHQTHNATALEQAGAAICLTEATMTPESLWSTMTELAADGDRRTRMAEAGRARSRPDAARAIARELLTLLPVAS